MRIVKIDGVDCFVFLEALKLDKGMVINVMLPVDASVPKAQREYVNYRNGIVVGNPGASEADKYAVRERARTIYKSLTADNVREHLEAAKKLVP